MIILESECLIDNLHSSGQKICIIWLRMNQWEGILSVEPKTFKSKTNSLIKLSFLIVLSGLSQIYEQYQYLINLKSSNDL